MYQIFKSFWHFDVHLIHLIHVIHISMYDEGDDEQAQGKPDPCLTDSATLKVYSIRIS